MKSQNERVLKHLEVAGSITPLEAIQYMGCLRLGARIYDLKKMGHNIKTQLVTVTNRRGELCTVAKYHLIKGAQENANI